MESSVVVRVLAADEAAVLENVAEEVFDQPVRTELTAELLADPRHHLAVALEGERVVGFASAVHYFHPDKPAQLFVNEVGVAPSHHRLGIARRLMQALLEVGLEHGCSEAWVATEPDNEAARGLYASLENVTAAEPCVIYGFSLRRG